MERYRRRARTLFVVLSIVAMLVVAVAVGLGYIHIPPEERAVLFAGQALVLVAYVVLYRALGRGDGWADRATLWVCAILIASGAIRSLVDLGSARITIPLEAIGAALVIRARPASGIPVVVSAAARDRGLAASVIAAVLLAQLVPALATAAPGVLEARPDDLVLDLAVTCPPAGSSRDDAAIDVELAWTWTRRAPVAPEADGLVIGWYATTVGSAPADAGLVVREVAISDLTITEGMDGAPGELLRLEVAPHLTVREFLIPREVTEASVRLVLVPRDRSAHSGSLDVDARYAHGDAWVRSAVSRGCGW